jgi:hypothetical protein
MYCGELFATVERRVRRVRQIDRRRLSHDQHGYAVVPSVLYRKNAIRGADIFDPTAARREGDKTVDNTNRARSQRRGEKK